MCGWLRDEHEAAIADARQELAKRLARELDADRAAVQDALDTVLDELRAGGGLGGFGSRMGPGLGADMEGPSAEPTWKTPRPRVATACSSG